MKNLFTQKLSCIALGFLLFLPQMKAEEVKVDYTDLLKNPGFEVVLDGDGHEVPISVSPVRFLPYGWSHTVVYNGVEIPWDATNNSSDATVTTQPAGANLKTSYGVSKDAQAKTIEGGYICWVMPYKPLDLLELYQEIPVGYAQGQLPPGEYVVSCRLTVMGATNSDRRFTTQRLFAKTATQNKVQYFGNATDYDQNLTAGEDATYANWISENTSSNSLMYLRPMSVTMTVNAGETLRVGLKTGNKAKDGTVQIGTDVGWFKLDALRIVKKDALQDDHTNKIVNSNFELKEGNKPIGGIRDWVEKFCPYGWNHTVVKAYNEDGTPIVLPWSATENNGVGTETAGGAAFGQSVGCNVGDNKITLIMDREYYSFWASITGMPEYTLYQDITGLSAGKYRVSCYMLVVTDKHRTQRLFANDQVQFFGSAEDYDLNKQLTREEKGKLAADKLTVTYAGNTQGGEFKPMSVDVTVGTGETLRLGVKTSGVDKEGNTGTTDAGSIRLDYFRLQLIEAGAPTSLAQAKEDFFTFKNQQGGFLLRMKEKIPAHIRIVSLSGQTVYSQAIKAAETLVHLPQGLYIVHLSADGVNKTVKVLVK